MRTLYLCGAGNSEGVRLALAINAARSCWDQIFLLDDDPGKHGRKLLGVEVIGGFGLLAEADADAAEVANLVARTTAGRLAARRAIAAYGVPFVSLVHPSIDLLGAELAGDVTVYPGATVGPEVWVGEGSVIFMGAVAGHEARVGAGCVLAANSVLNARVELGEGVYVGTNASVLPEICVGAGATIGAGSAVIEDVPPGVSVIGVPGRIFGAPAAAPDRVPAPVERERPCDPDLERRLAQIWAEILGLDEIGPEENFFDLGAKSLHALRVHERIEAEIGRALPLTDLFRFPTLRALAGHLGRSPAPQAVGGQGAARAEFRRWMRTRGARPGA